MSENGNCETCSKKEIFARTVKGFEDYQDKLLSNVETLQAEIEALHSQIADLQRQIPRPKPNLLGAGRKKKVTPQIEQDVLRLRAGGLSFGDIAIAINQDSPIKISRSKAYEIYDEYRCKQLSLSSDKSSES